MKLTATPFNPTTGELLPVYRDAYLRGDLARASAQAVEAYLRRDAQQAHSTVTRWHEMHTTDETAITPNWVQKQLRFIREEPQRFRRRAFSLAAMGALIAGASMASTMKPTKMQPLASTPVASLNELSAADVTAASFGTRTVLVHGRILNEKGKPLVGATVLRKGTALGTSTDAEGNYTLRVPAGSAVTLQYGYGGYADQELPAAGTQPEAVTLQPRAGAKHHRWFIF